MKRLFTEIETVRVGETSVQKYTRAYEKLTWIFYDLVRDFWV